MADLLLGFRWRDALDILLVAILIYQVLLMFRGTRTVQMLVGLGLLLGASVAARRVELHSIEWVLDNFWSFWVIALVVLFQPEFRRALTRIGHQQVVQSVLGVSYEERAQVADEVASAAAALAERRIGALIVLERATGLRQYAELGLPLDAIVSADLLGTVFMPGSPLHDGAVIIQRTRVGAAGCFLPLSRDLHVARTLGTRHRAALGIAEETDAVAVVVSEETGQIAIAVDGQIDRPVDPEALRWQLSRLLRAGPSRRARTAALLGGVRRLLPRHGNGG
jgi:uncharacterized protein (TIGR00159 family)